MRFKVDKKTALMVVDVQKDFCPSGALTVREGDKVVPILNDYIKKFRDAGAPIYPTRDWHPPDHISFNTRGGPWPPHCIQNTDGARFHSDLRLPKEATLISKAMNPEKEAYSGFDGTGLEEELKKKDVDTVFVGGLATDYCVKNTVLDAIKLGFRAVLLVDAVRGVDVAPGDSERAVDEMVRRGAVRATIRDL